MTFTINPMLETDCYKFDHRRQYPTGTEYIQSNWTPRGSRIDGIDSVMVFGTQAFVINLDNKFRDNFFNRDVEEVCAEYQNRLDMMLGPNDIGTDHIRALHELGYLPLRFRCIPEGTEVPLRIPMLTVENTHPDFFWLVNYIETMASAELWHPMTSATTAFHLRKMLDRYAEQTSSVPEMVDFQAHDFSFRGLSSVYAAAASGAAHLLSFAGTDSVPAIDWAKYYYGGNPVGLSVAATEHSVMSAGGAMSEAETFERLLHLYPGGIVSVVSDTWDLWHVLTEIVPDLKDQIMTRDGKLVIRPDSGDPVKILCGDPDAGIHQPAYKGVIELLWEEFGGTVNDKGFRELDSHIGAIYGDSITYERAEQICLRLAAKGFATTNVVLGVGSFTYQYVTRDTFGFAMKATWAQIDGEGRNLFKDPATDDGLKKSARGRLAVFEDTEGEFVLIEEASLEIENHSNNMLRVVFEDGKFDLDDWETILSRVGRRTIV